MEDSITCIIIKVGGEILVCLLLLLRIVWLALNIIKKGGDVDAVSKKKRSQK